ncbi:MAG: hypothetical protein CML17_13415 [Pusillimonas sp.]|nr:hypothetical protein [Pusillimonas sp.]
MKCATLADLICKINCFHLILLLQRGKVLVWFAPVSGARLEGTALPGYPSGFLRLKYLTYDMRLAAPQACVANAFRFYLLHSK